MGEGGSLKEDPSNWRSRIFPEHRETLPRLPGPGNLFASFTGAKNFFPSKFRKRCSAWRRGEGGILFLRSPDVPVVSTNARELTCPGEVRFCRCTPTDSRTTFIACRIYGVFALATETRGKYKFVPRRAEIFRLEIYFLGRFSSFFFFY